MQLKSISRRRKSKSLSRRKFKSVSRRKSKSLSRRKSKSVSRQKSDKRLKLVSIQRSPRVGKKYRATFNDGTHTDFGAEGYEHYGSGHRDEERKRRYLQRHRARENWNNPKSPGALSRYVLWNKKSLSASIADYKRRFNL